LPPSGSCPGWPRIISDNGPQFIARDFKQFIRLCGMTHVRTSPYYPQSNGKPCVNPLDALANSHTKTHAIATG